MTAAGVGSMVGSGWSGWLVVLVMVVAAACLWPGGGRLPEAPPDRRPPQGRDMSPWRADGAASGDSDKDDEPTAAGRAAPVSRASPRRRWGERARRAALEGALAELAAALAAPLRAGVPPAVAVAAAASTFRHEAILGPLLRELSTAAARGAPVAEVWLRQARRLDSPDLAFIGRAWALSELSGAPLVDALTCAEQVLRARSRSRERLAAAAAGPRASMTVLCLLPATGPVVGAVMGVDPLTLYFSSTMATASLLIGVGLGLGAWAWSRRILRRAA